MNNDYRKALLSLHAAIQIYTGQNPQAQQVKPAEITQQLMDALALSQAALNHPEPVPALVEVVEVAEVVAWLRMLRAHSKGLSTSYNDKLTRAATLLEQQLMEQLSAPAPAVVPVAVSERLPREEDCDEQGRCWWFSPPACGHHKIRPCWTLDSEVMEGDTHWCPYRALPLPQAEEVQP
jgi:hypothetical protein